MESEDRQLNPVGALGGHGERAVDEVLGVPVHALVHLEQLRLAVRVAVALQVRHEPGALRDGVPDAAHRVRLRESVGMIDCIPYVYKEYI